MYKLNIAIYYYFYEDTYKTSWYLSNV